jgi:dTDP-glucose 4,6-dehydratase
VVKNGKVGESYNVGDRAELPNLTLIETWCSTLDAAFGNDSELIKRVPSGLLT